MMRRLAILFNEDDTIWSASKSTATFHQHDVLHDSINLMDTFPRASASWNIEGEMSFVDDTRRTDDIPWDSQPSSTEHRAVDVQPFRPESTIATVTRFDPDFDHLSFATLANNYLLRGEDLGMVCDANAEVCRSLLIPMDEADRETDGEVCESNRRESIMEHDQNLAHYAHLVTHSSRFSSLSRSRSHFYGARILNTLCPRSVHPTNDKWLFPHHFASD